MRRNVFVPRSGSSRLFGIIALIAVCLSAGIAVARQRGADSPGRSAVSGQTATLMADGRVLIAGGEREGGAIATSEVYDPATGETAPGAVATYPRADHSATLLEDGRVLLAGGRNGSTALDAVEAWDPETSSFSIAGRLTVPRTGHAAVALDDGRVLFAGGDAGGTIEIWDGSSFSAIGTRLSMPRFGASAVLLRDGRVLVAGGRDANGAALDSADVIDIAYDHVSGLPMHKARVAPMLNVLPDGKVQVIGGDEGSTMEILAGDHFTALTVLRVLDPKAIAGTKLRFAFDRADATTIDAAIANGASFGQESNGKGITISRTRGVGVPGGAWVTTDKADYMPGETVVVTGGGFAAGETVTLLFERNPENTPATTLTALANANGEFTSSEYVCLPTDFGVTFTLTATGQTSGLIAVTSFTDAITSVSPSPGLVGDAVTIDGAGFGATTGTLAFGGNNVDCTGGTAAVVGTWTDTQITTTAPAGESGTVNVCVYFVDGGGGTFISLNAFTYCVAASTTDPTDKTITYGDNTSFSVTGSGSAALTFQWQEDSCCGFGDIANGGVYSGATTDTLTLTKPPVSMSGNDYRVIVSSSCGSGSSATSASAMLTVNKADPQAVLAGSPVTYLYYDALAHEYHDAAGVVPGDVTVQGVAGDGTLATATFPLSGDITEILYHGYDDDLCTAGLGWLMSVTDAGGYTVGVTYIDATGNYNDLTAMSACFTSTGCGNIHTAGQFNIAGSPHTITGPFTTNAPYDGLTQLGVPDVTVTARHEYEAPHALDGTATGRTLLWETYNSDDSPGSGPSDYCSIMSTTAADANGDSTATIRIDHATPDASSVCRVRAYYSDCDFAGTTAFTQDVFINPALVLIEWVTPNATDSATALTEDLTPVLGTLDPTPPQLDAVAYWVNSQTGVPTNTQVDGVSYPEPVSCSCTYTYTYYPTAGSFLPAGTGQTLSLEFTTDNPDFISPRAANQYIDVNEPAAPVAFCDTYHYAVAPPRTFMVDTTLGSPTVTSAALFKDTDVGAFISAKGIPAFSSILAYVNDSTVTISRDATVTGSPTATISRDTPPLKVLPNRSFTVLLTAASTTVKSSGNTFAGFLASDVGMTITGAGIPSGATITAFTSASEVTISAAPTKTRSSTAALSRTTNDGPMRGMVSSDFNGDGRIDLVVANDISLAFYEGKDDGTFKPPVEIATGFMSLYALVSGDFNGSGGTDIAVTDADDDKVYVYTNSGAAVPVWTLSDTLLTGDTPVGMITADLNGGAADLVVSNNGSSSVQIWTGAGDGTFSLLADAGLNSATYLLNAGDKPWDVVVGDFVSDADLDIMVALNGTTNSVAILEGDGTGRFVSLSKILKNAGGPFPRALAADDLDDDGDTDVIVGNYGNPATTPTGSVYKMIRTGPGTFTTGLLASVVRVSSIAIGDIANDGDSILDFGVVSSSAKTMSLFRGASTGADNYTVKAFVNNTMGIKATGASPYTVVLGDFDKTTSMDGKLEIATNGSMELKVFAPDVVPTATITSVKVGSAAADTVAPFDTSTGGASVTITVTLTGTGPYVVKWSDLVQQKTSSTTLTRTVKPSVTTTYTITSVKGGSACGGTVGPDGSVTLTVP